MQIHLSDETAKTLKEVLDYVILSLQVGLRDGWTEDIPQANEKLKRYSMTRSELEYELNK